MAELYDLAIASSMFDLVGFLAKLFVRDFFVGPSMGQNSILTLWYRVEVFEFECRCVEEPHVLSMRELGDVTASR